MRLLCDPEENARRIVSPERRARFKEVNPKGALERGSGAVLRPERPNTLTLDTTRLEPEEAAERILDVLEHLSARG